MSASADFNFRNQFPKIKFDLLLERLAHLSQCAARITAALSINWLVDKSTARACASLRTRSYLRKYEQAHGRDDDDSGSEQDGSDKEQAGTGLSQTDADAGRAPTPRDDRRVYRGAGRARSDQLNSG